MISFTNLCYKLEGLRMIDMLNAADGRLCLDSDRTDGLCNVLQTIDELSPTTAMCILIVSAFIVNDRVSRCCALVAALQAYSVDCWSGVV